MAAPRPEFNEELDAYNPLIPDGSNWKATFMVEFPDEEERCAMLSHLVGIENNVWLQVGDSQRIRPIADQDLERADEEKTSAVHFLRFELDRTEVQSLKEGATLSVGIDHENFQVDVSPVAENVGSALVSDLD